MHAFWEKRVRSNGARGHPFVAAKLPLQATGYLSLALPALHGSHKILHRLWICHLQSLLELHRINVAIAHEFCIEAHQTFPGSPGLLVQSAGTSKQAQWLGDQSNRNGRAPCGSESP